MEYVELNNGIKMPQLGFGVYQVPADECQKVVEDAIDVGYRSFDTAAAYGNETEVGAAIAASGIPRDEFFVTTKLWISDTTYDGAKRGFEDSMKKLGLDYIDLYMLHQPYNDIFGAWRALEELYKQGVIRAIGVANFAPGMLANLMAFTEVKPAVDQIECNIYFQQQKAQDYLRSRDVAMESWAPFAEGHGNLFSNPTLEAIGDKYGKSVAQVVLRWQLQRGIICIPKSTHKDRMQQNFDVFDFKLSEADMADIAALDKDMSSFFDHWDPKMVEMLTGGGRYSDQDN